jgi:16S rRNA processing protein RimM
VPDCMAEIEIPGEVLDTWPADAVEIGRVIGAWGIKGALKVQAYASSPQGLFSTKRWYLAEPERQKGLPGKPAVSSVGIRSASAPQQPRVWPRLVRVIHAREQGDAVVATLQDLTDRNGAEALVGARIHVPRSGFPTPEPDEFYWVDLIGLQVMNREGVNLGTVEGLLETGPHCVLRLSSLDVEGKSRMVPFVAAYVDDVSLEARRILVDWPADY